MIRVKYQKSLKAMLIPRLYACWTWLSCVLLFSILAACGGGGEPGGPSSEDLQRARAAGVFIVYQPDSSNVRFSWSDTFALASQYQLQVRTAEGPWATVDAIPGAGGQGGLLTLQRVFEDGQSFRILAVLPSYSVPLKMENGGENLAPILPTPIPQIVLSQSGPVTGTLQMSLDSANGISAVEWFIDLQLAGSGLAAANGFAFSYNVDQLTSGSHMLLARAMTGPGSFVELRRTIDVYTPETQASIYATGTFGPARINVKATSESGITRVTASIDGRELGSLTATNWCEANTCFVDDYNLYSFPINIAEYSSGTHQLQAVVVDGEGHTLTVTRQVVFSNPPVLNVTSPVDGALVHGTLHLVGSASSDKPSGSVRTLATLGPYSILDTTDASFDIEFDLSGVPAGNYTLTVRTTDASGDVASVQHLITVVKTPPPQALLSLGNTGSLLAVDDEHVLYRLAAGESVRMHSVGGADVILQDSVGMLYTQNWQLDEQHSVAIVGLTGGWRATWWRPDGSKIDLNASNPFYTGGDSARDAWPVLHYPYLIWLDGDSNTFMLFNVVTEAYHQIDPPDSMGALGNNAYSFSVQDDALQFFFWGSSQSIMRWDSQDGSFTPITTEGINVAPQTDGSTVAWTAKQLVDGEYVNSLVAGPVDGSSHALLASDVSYFLLGQGVLAWIESNPERFELKARTNGRTWTLSQIRGSRLLAVSGGHVIYTRGGHMYRWNDISGEQLLLETIPGNVKASGKQLYFTNGEAQTLYRLALP